MATGTKKKSTSKTTSRRRESAKAREARLRAQRQMRAVVLLAAGLLLLALGCSWFVASLGVYVRDTPYCVTVILQMLYFMTPIFYPTSAVPEGFRWLHRINPLALIVEETRRILLYGQLPNLKALVLAMVAGIVAAQLGLLWFIRTKRGFADVI